MFYRLAMRSIQARAGISTDKIGARGPMGLNEWVSATARCGLN
jgi:gamma-glutamyl phosphate reductase